jgi:hypothetical protein
LVGDRSRAALRFGQDDKFEGGCSPWQWWKWMDRTSTTATNPVSFARVLFNAFSKLRRPEGRSSANLDSFALGRKGG